MSLARKCNMCQKCFDPMEEKGRMARFENPIFQTSNDIKEMARGSLLVPELGVDGIVDLCPDCSDKFLEFFLGGFRKVKSDGSTFGDLVRNVLDNQVIDQFKRDDNHRRDPFNFKPFNIGGDFDGD